MMRCRLWKYGKTGSGYGAHYPKGLGKQVLIHRYIYQCAHGELPKNMVVMHLCDNPTCYKLSHLKLGTQKDNISDMFSKGRQHDRRGDLGNHSKLSTQDVTKIKIALQENSSVKNRKKLAAEFNVSYTAIFDILFKRTWAHLTV